jgi:hypothetical protein
MYLAAVRAEHPFLRAFPYIMIARALPAPRLLRAYALRVPLLTASEALLDLEAPLILPNLK